MYSKSLKKLGFRLMKQNLRNLLSAGKLAFLKYFKGKVHRRNVYDALNRLIEKGLVFAYFKRRTPVSGSDAGQAGRSFGRKRQKLSKILPDLKIFINQNPRKKRVYLQRQEGYKNFCLYDTGGRRHLLLGAKALWFTPWVEKQYLEDYQAVKRKTKIFYALRLSRKEKFLRFLKTWGRV